MIETASASVAPETMPVTAAGPAGMMPDRPDRPDRPGRMARRRMPAVVGLFRWRTTPDRIRGMAAAAVVAAVLLGVIMAAVSGSIASGLQLIGHRSDPEVLATTDLYFRLNDMDAQGANVLLGGRGS